MAAGPPVNELRLPFFILIQIHIAYLHETHTHTYRKRERERHTQKKRETPTHTHTFLQTNTCTHMNTVAAGNIEVNECLTSFLSAPIHFSFNDVRGCERCQHHDVVPSNSISASSSFLQDTKWGRALARSSKPFQLHCFLTSISVVSLQPFILEYITSVSLTWQFIII